MRSLVLPVTGGAVAEIRRMLPVAGTLIVAAVIAAAAQLGPVAPVAPVSVVPVLLAYACGAYAQTWPGLAATVALIVALQLYVGFADAPNLEIAVATLPIWWAGREVRQRRQVVRDLTARTRELEREEEAFVRLAVQRERARIARDLHDIVSHHVAVIVQALAEAHRLVRALQPGVDAPKRLAPLLERARALGASVVVIPASIALPPETEAIAHAVVREAITNAIKHALAARLEIRIAAEQDGTVVISARNALSTATSTIATTGSGLGIVGMRERVEMVGGTLLAESDGGDGFVLRATLPFAST
jgi:signal transduction histidine kinase